MLHRNLSELKGFRSLTASELEAVSGGFEITVNGIRPSNPGFGGGGGSGLGGNGNETGNEPHPSLLPDGSGGAYEIPVEVTLDPNERTADVSFEVEEGLNVGGTIDLDGFDLEKLSLSFLKNGQEFNFELNIDSLQFGVDTLFDLGNGVTLRAMLQLDNDGTLNNGSVIFRIEF